MPQIPGKDVKEVIPLRKQGWSKDKSSRKTLSILFQMCSQAAYQPQKLQRYILPPEEKELTLQIRTEKWLTDLTRFAPYKGSYNLL